MLSPIQYEQALAAGKKQDQQDQPNHRRSRFVFQQPPISADQFARGEASGKGEFRARAALPWQACGGALAGLVPRGPPPGRQRAGGDGDPERADDRQDPAHGRRSGCLLLSGGCAWPDLIG